MMRVTEATPGRLKHHEDPGQLKAVLLANIMERETGFKDDQIDASPEWGVSARMLVHDRPKLRAKMCDIGFDFEHDITGDLLSSTPRQDGAELIDLNLWQPFPWGQFGKGLAHKLFDLAAFMGPQTAIRLVQRSCRAFERPVEITGVLCPKSAGVIRCLEQDYGNLSIITTLKAEAAGLWRTLVAIEPDLEPFANGWLKRAYF